MFVLPSIYKDLEMQSSTPFPLILLAVPIKQVLFSPLCCYPKPLWLADMSKCHY